MKFGFEYEEFITDKDGNIRLVPDDFPKDDCGWLIEYRGEPHDNPYEAVGALKAVMTRERSHFKEAHPDLKLQGTELPFANVPRALKLEARRHNTKGLDRFQNLYGRKPTQTATAGLHLSITRERVIYVKSKNKGTYNALWDYAQFIRFMDKEYAKAIKATKRVPGFYELKDDGRFEYRSLPITVDLWKLAKLLYNYRF